MRLNIMLLVIYVTYLFRLRTACENVMDSCPKAFESVEFETVQMRASEFHGGPGIWRDLKFVFDPE